MNKRNTGKKVIKMEDEHFIGYPFNENYAVFGVYDGHNGREGAHEANRLFKEELTKLLTTPRDDLSEIFDECFRRIDSYMASTGNFEYIGTTATVVVIWRNSKNERVLQAANVGDSSAFLYRNGEAYQLTFDHKVSNSEEKERILAMSPDTSEDQNRICGLAISRTLGDHFTKREKTGIIGTPYISPPIKILDTDSTLIIASDGLWDVMGGQRALDQIRFKPSAEAMAKFLLEAALNSPKCRDNVTICIIRLNIQLDDK